MGDVELGGFWYFVREYPGKPPEAEVFKVVATCEEPTVTLENVATGKRETHAVTSHQFARFAKLSRKWSDGSRD